MFTKFSHQPPISRIKVADGKPVHVKGVGDVNLKIPNSTKDETIDLHLKNVLYIPDIPINLISTRSLWNSNQISTTFANACTLKFPNGTSVSFDTGNKGHYYCVARSSNVDQTENVSFSDSVCSFSSEQRHSLLVTSDIIHARLGHCGHHRADLALKGSVGLPEAHDYRKRLSEKCEGCLLGGARKAPLHAIPSNFQPKTFGERIHSDLCGPFPASSTGKWQYILSFVDSATGYSEIALLETKLSTEILPHFERFVKKWKHKLPNGMVQEWGRIYIQQHQRFLR